MLSSPGVPSRSPQRRPAGSTAFALTCFALVAIAAVIRSLAVAEPLGIDQSLWASAVRGMARGQRLYADVWEQRPPGIYLTYLAGFTALGWTPATVVWLDVAASVVTSGILYALGGALGNRRVGAAAAALFAVLTMPAWQYSYGGFLERAVCETFIVVCVAGAALCAARLRQHASQVSTWGFGLLAGAAVLFKPNAVLYFPGLLVWALAGTPLASAGRRKWMAVSIEVAAAASVLPVLAIVWLWHLGVLGDAKTAVIDFNRWYVAAGFEPATYVVALWRAIKQRATTDPLWLAGGVASIAALTTLVRERRLTGVPAVATIWGAGTFLMIVVNGSRLFNSYFSQALAPLALLTAWWLVDGAAGSVVRRTARVATAIVMVALLWHRGFVTRVADAARADAAVSAGRLDRLAYLERFGGYANGRGYSARANDELAAYIRSHTAPDDRIYLFGINGAGVYFDADRLTAHRFLRVNFFVPDDFPNPAFTLEAVARDLQERQPRYLIFETLHATSDAKVARAVDSLPENPALQPLLAAYALEARIEDFSVFGRR